MVAPLVWCPTRSWTGAKVGSCIKPGLRADDRIARTEESFTQSYQKATRHLNSVPLGQRSALSLLCLIKAKGNDAQGPIRDGMLAFQGKLVSEWLIS